MQHRGSAHTCAHIRGASSQITELWVIGEIEFALEGAVNFINQFESSLQLQAGADRLHTQVIFLIDHDAERLPAIHDNGAANTFGSMLAANQMALDQNLFFSR